MKILLTNAISDMLLKRRRRGLNQSVPPKNAEHAKLCEIKQSKQMKPCERSWRSVRKKLHKPKKPRPQRTDRGSLRWQGVRRSWTQRSTGESSGRLSRRQSSGRLTSDKG